MYYFNLKKKSNFIPPTCEVFRVFLMLTVVETWYYNTDMNTLAHDGCVCEQRIYVRHKTLLHKYDNDIQRFDIHDVVSSSAFQYPFFGYIVFHKSDIQIVVADEF